MTARGECNCGALRFAQFRWVQGQEHVTKWAKPNTSREIFFCSICGPPVPGQNDANTMFVPAGTLSAGGETLQVIHHVRVGSRAVRDETGDSGRQHAGAFSD